MFNLRPSCGYEVTKCHTSLGTGGMALVCGPVADFLHGVQTACRNTTAPLNAHLAVTRAVVA